MFALAGFLCLLGIGLPIFVIFIIVGFTVYSFLMGIEPALALLGQTFYYGIATPTYTTLPLFILMGAFAARAGFAEDAYKSILILFRKIPGSLAITTCWSSALFGAISGSSLAGTVVFGKIAYPEMKKYNYNKIFSLASIVCAGTFGSLIPPSSLLIIIAIITEQSVGELFMAGIIPGIVTATVYSILILIRSTINKKLAPVYQSDEKYTLKEKFNLAKTLIPVVILIITVLGGIYSGIFTVTEAAAVGTALTLVFGIIKGNLRKISEVRAALKDSAQSTAMLFLIMGGAIFFGRVLARTRLPMLLSTKIVESGLSPLVVVFGIYFLFLIGGMFMNASALFLITFPIVFPAVLAVGINPILFSIGAIKLSEIAAVSPPVGLNVFALKGIIGDEVSIGEIFSGVFPYIIADLVVLVIIFIFPSLVLYIPQLYMR